MYLRAEKIGGWSREVIFHPTRKWRLDFFFHEPPTEGILAGTGLRLAIEVEGITSFGQRKASCKKCGAPVPGQMILGRHQTAKGMQEDVIKYSSAMTMGIWVHRITQQDISKVETYDHIRTMIGAGGKPVLQQGGLNLEASDSLF